MLEPKGRERVEERLFLNLFGRVRVGQILTKRAAKQIGVLHGPEDSARERD